MVDSEKHHLRMVPPLNPKHTEKDELTENAQSQYEAPCPADPSPPDEPDSIANRIIVPQRAMNRDAAAVEVNPFVPHRMFHEGIVHAK